MFLTAVVFFLILGTLVLVHELGHFLVAKRNGIQSEEFGFGFPPRIAGTYKDAQGKRKWIFGNKEIEKEILDREETVYSINLIPLGGFVKIKGENGEAENEPNSFASQPIWTRFKVLVAGVSMNVLLAIVLFSLAFAFGLPETIDDDKIPAGGSKIQIAGVVADSPAKSAGFEIGDEIVSIEKGNEVVKIETIGEFQQIVKENPGKEIVVNLVHPGDETASSVKVVPREKSPEGQGLLGVELVRTTVVKHGIFESIWMGITATFSMIWLILAFLGDLIVKIFSSEQVSADVAGPVGIAVLTGQVTKMGFAFILQFAAVLSVNLAVINLLPIPALDGGRIVFLLIEKIKGSPVSQKVEGFLHTAGFVALISLMVFVTARDFANFKIIEKIMGLF